MSYVTPMRKDPWKLLPGFLQLSPHAPYPFADLALYSFAIMNLRHECDYLPNPGSPSRESPNLGKGLATLDLYSTVSPSHFMT